MSHQSHAPRPGPAIDGLSMADKPHPYRTSNYPNKGLAGAKTYRIVLHSADIMEGSSATNALFDVGNLSGRWNLPMNVDGGRVLYHCHVKSFKLATDGLEPPIVEILASEGFQIQPESWDSKTKGMTNVLAVAAGSIMAWTDAVSDDGLTLGAVPEGLLGIALRSREAQAELDADASLVWSMVIVLTPFLQP